jgi:hypothetical protein
MGQTGPVDVRNPCLLYTEVRQFKSLVELGVGEARKLRPTCCDLPTASQHTWIDFGAAGHVVIPAKNFGY